MKREYAIALGFFDGVHLGHQTLLQRTVERAKEHDLIPAVFTFDRAPKEVVTGQKVHLLTTPEERCRIIRTLFPIETIFVAPFDKEMMEMEWEDYLAALQKRFSARWLIAGDDHCFGHQNKGNVTRLREWCQRHHIGVDIMPQVMMDGSPISSSRIRTLLEVGDREKAVSLLGHTLL